MTPQKYIQEATATKSGLKINLNQGNEDLLHAVLGVCSESGEFADSLKKHLFYGQPLDIPNIKEELGDTLWYIALACEWLNCSFEELMELNIEKLRIRYPEVKWSKDKALNRDLTKEREILEK